MTKSKNVTFTLPPELIEKYKNFVKHNYFPSVNAGVKEALEEYSKRIEKDVLMKELQKAVRDPLFMADLKDNMEKFEFTDKESIKESSEW